MHLLRTFIISFIAIISFCHAARGQTMLLDSLKSSVAKVTDDSTRFALYIQLADLSLYDKPDTSKYYASEAEKIAESLNNQRFRAYVLNRYASVEWSLGNIETAFRQQTEALERAKEVRDTVLVAKCLSNIGTLYSATGNDLMAINYSKQTLPFYLSTNNVNRLVASHNNIGKSYLEIGLLDSAILYLNKAVTFIDDQHEWMKPIVLFNIAETYFRLNKIDTSRIILENQLLISRHFNDQRSICRSHQLMAEIELVFNNPELAQKHINIAKPIAEKSRVKELIYICYYTHAKVLEALGNYKEALEANALAQTYEDSVIRQSVKNELAYYNFRNVNKEIESLRQESEINRLRAESQLLATWALGAILVLIVIVLAVLFLGLRNIKIRNNQLKEKNSQIAYQKAELERQSDELQKLNHSKDRIISIVTHDFRSPLASLHSLMTMLNKDLISEEEFKQLIPEVNKSLVSTSLLLESLLIWAKEQINNHVLKTANIDLKKALQDVLLILEDQLQEKEITIEKHLEGDCIVLADPSVLQIVLRNILSNAIKFSHRKSKIVIATQNESEHLIITIKDFGVGMKPKTREELFSKEIKPSTGTSGEKGSGIGLLICKEFIEKSKGNISVESTEGVCTVFTISLPRPENEFIQKKIVLN